MSIQKFLQDVSYDNICQEAMQALSPDVKLDKDVTIPILKIAYLCIDYLFLTMVTDFTYGEEHKP